MSRTILLQCKSHIQCKLNKPGWGLTERLASFGVKYDQVDADADADADTYQDEEKNVQHHGHLAFEQTLMWSKC